MQKEKGKIKSQLIIIKQKGVILVHPKNNKIV
jgi:hypothetical protein